MYGAPLERGISFHEVEKVFQVTSGNCDFHVSFVLLLSFVNMWDDICTHVTEHTLWTGVSTGLLFSSVIMATYRSIYSL